MRLSKIKISISIIFLFFCFVIYHILFGRLLAFSPIIVGFEKYKTEYATVYYHKNEKKLDNKVLDSLILKVEQFHKLNFNKQIRIFICKTDKEYKRYTGSSARFVTVLSYAIFISGKANNERKINRIHLNTYLKHELSHLLLYQNMSLLRALNYPQWFLEGLAVFSSNQFGIDGYLTKKETYERIEQGYFVKPEDYGTALSAKGESVKNCNLKNKYRFIYSEFACIISDMINTFGKKKFIDFLRLSLQSNDFYALFKKIFNESFSEYLNKFKIRIKDANNTHNILSNK